MQNRSIGFDLDGVIAETYKVVLPVLKKMYPDRVKDYKFDCDWEKYYNLTSDEVKNCFIKSGELGLLKDAPIYENAKRTLYKLNKKYNIYIVTWRNYIPRAREDTLYWLDSNKIPYYRLILSKNKFRIAEKENFCFFVDDTIDVCNRVAKSKVPTYLFNRPWNKGQATDAMVKRIASWKEIGNILLPY